MKSPSTVWKGGTVVSPLSHAQHLRAAPAGAHFPMSRPARKVPPRAVHFLNLAGGPEPSGLTARVHQHLQAESAQTVFHFRIHAERSSRIEFLTLSGAVEHPARVRLHPETFFEKRVHLRGTDLTTAYQRLLPCLLDYTDRLPMTLTDLPPDTPKRFLTECILNGHWIYLMLEAEEAQLCQASLLVKSLPARFLDSVRPILLASAGGRPLSRKTLQGRIGVPVRHIVRPACDDLHIPKGSKFRNDPGGRRQGQFRRIAREIGRCRMGLVLSSGGAKGFSYVGVIQVLEELGLDFDIVAGSSFGAVVGALWARGYDGEQLEDIARNFKSWTHLLKIIDHAVDLRRGLIRGKRLENYLRSLLDGACFSQLSLPLAITATDIQSLQSKLVDHGDVASALHASSAIPGICVPCERDGRLFIDGGVANPLPVHTLKQMGIERVVAVSTVLEAEQGVEMGQHRRDAEAAFGRNHPVAHFLNKRLNLFAQGNAFDTLMRSIEAAQIRLVERDTHLADLVLQPLPYDSRWQDFTNPDKYVEAGRRTAASQVDALMAVESARRKGVLQ